MMHFGNGDKPNWTADDAAPCSTGQQQDVNWRSTIKHDWTTMGQTEARFTEDLGLILRQVFTLTVILRQWSDSQNIYVS